MLERDDGGRQVMYNVAPLYFFAGDSAPKQTNGHGVGGAWFVAALGDHAKRTARRGPFKWWIPTGCVQCLPDPGAQRSPGFLG